MLISKTSPPQSKPAVNTTIATADSVQHDFNQGIDTLNITSATTQPAPSPLSTLSLGTNLLELGLLIPNLSAEYRFNRWGSVALSGNYSGWNYFKSTLKFRVSSLCGELRVWPAAKPTGLFVGAHAITGCFNIALGDNDAVRRQSHNGFTLSYGGGLTLGYRFTPFSDTRWQMEVSGGAGVHSLYYDEFQNRTNGLRIDTKRKLYVGPDCLRVSLIYNLPLKKKGGES